MAHHAFLLAARLPLHPAGWKPERKSANEHQPDPYHALGRTLARGELDFCVLGFVAWHWPDVPQVCGDEEPGNPAPPNCRLDDDLRLRLPCLDIFSSQQLRAGTDHAPQNC